MEGMKGAYKEIDRACGKKPMEFYVDNSAEAEEDRFILFILLPVKTITSVPKFLMIHRTARRGEGIDCDLCRRV